MDSVGHAVSHSLSSWQGDHLKMEVLVILGHVSRWME